MMSSWGMLARYAAERGDPAVVVPNTDRRYRCPDCLVMWSSREEAPCWVCGKPGEQGTLGPQHGAPGWSSTHSYSAEEETE